MERMSSSFQEFLRGWGLFYFGRIKKAGSMEVWNPSEVGRKHRQYGSMENAAQ